MWVEVKEAPAKLRELGLGGEPVYSHSDGVWYALSGNRVMMHHGLGATNPARAASQPRDLPAGGRTTARFPNRYLRPMPQMPQLMGPTMLGALQNPPPGGTTDGNLLSTAQAVLASPSPCDLQGRTDGNPEVLAFQVAWNQTSDPNISGDPGWTPLTTDGRYGQNTADALSAALGDNVNIEAPCGSFINLPGAGGGPMPGPAPSPSPAPSPAPAPTPAGKSAVVPVLVGAAILGTSLVGLAYYTKKKKRH